MLLRPIRPANRSKIYSFAPAPHTTSSSIFHSCASQRRVPLQYRYDYHQYHQRRRFSSPNQNQRYTACHTFPYPALSLYDIIADVSSYSSFLPYCTDSHVSSWSAPDAHYHRHWPHIAMLSVGYDPGIPLLGAISESFSSRVFCAPPVPEQVKGEERLGPGIVEAVIGSAEPLMDMQRRRHHEPTVVPTLQQQKSSGIDARDDGRGPIDWLRTQWVVRSQSKGETQVSFLLEYRFKHPTYEMLSSAVAPKIAGVMINVFERRAKELLT